MAYSSIFLIITNKNILLRSDPTPLLIFIIWPLNICTLIAPIISFFFAYYYQKTCIIINLFNILVSTIAVMFTLNYENRVSDLGILGKLPFIAISFSILAIIISIVALVKNHKKIKFEN